MLPGVVFLRADFSHSFFRAETAEQQSFFYVGTRRAALLDVPFPRQ